ncbi:hypothetical protein FRB94_009956 [Tulasnella sp. JGI-2019a]|nr:hypothetical protein FRB93_009135 [Tulasnella sp. JGI-2019a]KAG8994321.1 hypothetical protein FRB94_009956 [Tulasnella sp. JGI-2019a]
MLSMALALVLVVLATTVCAQDMTILMTDPQLLWGFEGQPLVDFIAAISTDQYGTYGDSCGGWVAVYNATASVRLQFSGSSITTNLIYDQNGGSMNLVIDGVAQQTASNVREGEQAPDQCTMGPVEINGLAPGVHTLDVVKASDAGIVYIHSFAYSTLSVTDTPIYTTETTTSTPSLESASTSSLTIQSFTTQSLLSNVQSSSATTPLAASTPSSLTPPSFDTASSLQSSKIPLIAALIVGFAIFVALLTMVILLRRRKKDRLAGLRINGRDGPGILDDAQPQYGMLMPSYRYRVDSIATRSRSDSTLTDKKTMLPVIGYTGGSYPLSPSLPSSGFRLPPPVDLDRWTGPQDSEASTSLNLSDDDEPSTQQQRLPSIPPKLPLPTFTPLAQGFASPVPSNSGATTRPLKTSGSTYKSKPSQRELVKELIENRLSDAEIASALRVLKKQDEAKSSRGDSIMAELDFMIAESSQAAANSNSNPPPRYTYSGNSTRT